MTEKDISEHELPPHKRSEPTLMMLASEAVKLFHDRLRNSESSEQNIRNTYRELLRHLTVRDGRTQLELSRLTHLKAPTISVTLQKMERDGYVTRTQDEKDLRQTLVYLTNKGREYDRLARSRITELDEKIMEGITPEEREIACHTLLKLISNIENSGKDTDETD